MSDRLEKAVTVTDEEIIRTSSSYALTWGVELELNTGVPAGYVELLTCCVYDPYGRVHLFRRLFAAPGDSS